MRNKYKKLLEKYESILKEAVTYDKDITTSVPPFTPIEDEPDGSGDHVSWFLQGIHYNPYNEFYGPQYGGINEHTPMSLSSPCDVFISYNSEDTEQKNRDLEEIKENFDEFSEGVYIDKTSQYWDVPFPEVIFLVKAVNYVEAYDKRQFIETINNLILDKYYKEWSETAKKINTSEYRINVSPKNMKLSMRLLTFAEANALPDFNHVIAHYYPVVSKEYFIAHPEEIPKDGV